MIGRSRERSNAVTMDVYYMQIKLIFVDNNQYRSTKHTNMGNTFYLDIQVDLDQLFILNNAN